MFTAIITIMNTNEPRTSSFSMIGMIACIAFVVALVCLFTTRKHPSSSPNTSLTITYDEARTLFNIGVMSGAIVIVTNAARGEVWGIERMVPAAWTYCTGTLGDDFIKTHLAKQQKAEQQHRDWSAEVKKEEPGWHANPFVPVRAEADIANNPSPNWVTVMVQAPSNNGERDEFLNRLVAFVRNNCPPNTQMYRSW